MKKTTAHEPLSVSVAKGLQAAARIARKRAKETKTPLILWKDGKVVRVRVNGLKSK